MRLSEDEISAVRSKADIADIIGRYIPLVKKGKSYSAVCPFHDDHSPSLSISQEKQIYKCFVCDAGGNIFTFVQNYENLSFPEAVVKVADLIGYPLTFKPQSIAKKVDPHKEAGFKVMNEAIQYMMYTLGTTAAKEEKEYLVHRGINQKLIETFEIGFNDAQDGLYKFLSAKGYKEIDLVSTNLARITETGLHDTFSARITFPIHDGEGNPVGFTARTLNPNIPSKYINTMETEFYVKSKVLYNLHRSKMHAKKQNAMILVEGVTDVIALAKAGILNVCATLGTAGTKEQLQQLKSCTSNLVFCYDGDLAGQKATYRVGQQAKELGFIVSIVKNTTGLDPDEIIEKRGIEELQRIIKNAQSWMEFVFDHLAANVDLNNYSEKKEFAKQVIVEIEKLRDDFDRQNFTHRLTQMTGFNLSSLIVQENQKKSVSNNSEKKMPKAKIPTIAEGRYQAEEIILGQMLLSIKAAEMFKAELGFMTDAENQNAAMLILEEYRKREELSIAGFIDSLVENKKIQGKIIRLSTTESLPKEYSESVLRGALKRVKKALLEDKVSDLKRQIKIIGNEQSQEILLQEYNNNLIELRRYIDEEENDK